MPMPTHVNGRPVKTGSWTQLEDDLLAEWQGKLGNKWSSVARKIPGRTGQQCAQRWRHKVNPNIRKEKWTEDEDDLLISLVHEFGNAWAEISRRMDGRTDQQVMGRWRRHLDPGIRREAWKPREDTALAMLYEQWGSQWSAIAKGIPGRTAQQCRARWFQVEAADGPTGRSKPVKKDTAGKAAARAPAYEDDESELEYDDDAELNFIASVRLASVQEADEEEEEFDDYDSEDNVSPPGDLSTPLKKAYTRAMTNSRTRRRRSSLSTLTAPPSGRSCGTTVQPSGDRARQASGAQPSGGRNASSRWATFHEAQADAGRLSPEDDEDYAEPEEEASTPGSYPSNGRRSSRRPSSELASPPFLSQHSHAHSMPSEAQLLGAHVHATDIESPGHSLLSTHKRYLAETTPQRTMRPLGGGSNRSGTTPCTPRSTGTKRSTPGGGFKVTEDHVWGDSPGSDVLHLFQSPHPGDAQSDLLQSPGFQRLETPDWAKRDWVPGVAPSSAPTCQQGSEEAPANRPLNRGPVARRLNIDSAMRAGVSRDGAGSPGAPMWTVPLSMPSSGRRALQSPAKKFKATPDRVSGAPLNGSEPTESGLHPHRTPSRMQREQQAGNGALDGTAKKQAHASPALVDAISVVNNRNLTDKENSACNALKQLSMAAAMAEASTGDASSAQTNLDVVQPAKLASPKSMPVAKPSQIGPPRLVQQATPRGSSNVRMRLHALLEDL